MRPYVTCCIRALVVLSCASPLAAQGGSSPGAVSVPDALRGLEPRARADVVAVIDSARSAGLPVDALTAKVVEGTTKGASAERIVRVVYEAFATMRTARTVLGPDRSAGEISAGGGALRAGLTTGDLQRIRSASRDRSMTESLVVATDLLRRGVPAADAVGAVVRLAEAGADGEAYLQLQSDVAQDVAAGVAPRTAALERARALSVRPGTKPSPSSGPVLPAHPGRPQ